MNAYKVHMRRPPEGREREYRHRYLLVLAESSAAASDLAMEEEHYRRHGYEVVEVTQAPGPVLRRW